MADVAIQRVILDGETGEERYVELTAEEVAELQADQAAILAELEANPPISPAERVARALDKAAETGDPVVIARAVAAALRGTEPTT